MEPKENKSEQNDQAWFDALTGKSDVGQGARLRRMLHEAERADAVQEDTTHDWQRLQFAMRREAMRPVNKPGYGLRYFALAASVLIVVGTVSMLMPKSDVSNTSSPETAAVMRGTSEQVIFSATPSQEAKQLESELVRLGINVIRRGDSDKIVLHISLVYPVSDEVRAVLESCTIPVPDQGALTVTFVHASR